MRIINDYLTSFKHMNEKNKKTWYEWGIFIGRCITIPVIILFLIFLFYVFLRIPPITSFMVYAIICFLLVLNLLCDLAMGIIYLKNRAKSFVPPRKCFQLGEYSEPKVKKGCLHNIENYLWNKFYFLVAISEVIVFFFVSIG